MRLAPLLLLYLFFFFFQAEDGIRDLVRSRGLGDVYKRQITDRISRGDCTLLAETVRRLDQESDAPILFLIDSPGGTGPAAEMLTAVISFCRSPTIGLVGCRAASSAFEILQACDLRLAFAASFVPVSYTHLTLPTSALGYVSGGAGFLQKK